VRLGPERTAGRGCRTVGDSLKQALLEQAQLTSTVEADATGLLQLWRRTADGYMAREGFALAPLPFFVLAAAQALKRATRAYILETGEIVREGTGQELANDPAVKAAYLGGDV